MKETKEYKIKWEIELDAESPEQAAEMALEMIQSKDSDAKVFEVDGNFIDVAEVQDRKFWDKIAADIVGDVKLTFGRAPFLQFENDEYAVMVWKDRAKWLMEVSEHFEQSRGPIGQNFYIMDDKELL
jgi:hypothetical protein